MQENKLKQHQKKKKQINIDNEQLIISNLNNNNNMNILKSIYDTKSTTIQSSIINLS